VSERGRDVLSADFLAVAFVWAEWATARLVRRQRRRERGNRAALIPGSPPELVDRLKIFQEFSFRRRQKTT
jgi:hypothetical protein